MKPTYVKQNKPTRHKTSQPENKIMKITDSIKNSSIKRHCLSLAIVTFGLTLILKPTAAHAQGEEPSSFHLDAIAPCLANAVAKVTVFPKEETRGVDTLELRAHGLPPNTTFAVFLTELPVPPFGAVQYVADFTTNAAGRGHVRVDAIINEAFAFNNITGVRTDLNHIVFWFADPADDEDCVPGSAPTHFDGDGVAGVAAMSSKNFLPGAPLP
jgi:hypothetical protein